MLRFVVAPLVSFVLAFCLGGLGAPDAQAQSPRMQRAPGQHRTAPSPGTGSAPARTGHTPRSDPAGTKLPAYAEPSAPPAYGPAPSGTGTPGQAQSNSGPLMPTNPDQVPLGGTEWLAAAGAAYALNRLRNEEVEEEDEES